MKEQNNKQDAVRAVSQDLRPLLLRFVEEGELSEDLYDACCRAAHRLVGVDSSEKDWDEDTRDLAVEFLVHCVHPNHLVDIRSVSGLSREMARFHTRRESPERRELWSALSEAIRLLAEQGRAVRIDADWRMNNSNMAFWALPDIGTDRILDIEAYRKAADQIGSFYPRNESSRIITPSDAVALVDQLLQAAAAPVSFELINHEACRHVVFRMQHQEELDVVGEDGDLISTHAIEYRYDVAVWMEEEANQRSASIWDKTSALDDGQAVLCRYFLPKHFLNQDVNLSSIGGDFRRHSERSQVIRKLFAGELALHRIGAERGESLDAAFSKALVSLTGLVAARLMNKCSEIFPNLNFNLFEPECDGDNDHD
jgi:hypothetical protein